METRAVGDQIDSKKETKQRTAEAALQRYLFPLELFEHSLRTEKAQQSCHHKSGGSDSGQGDLGDVYHRLDIDVAVRNHHDCHGT